MAAIKFVRPEDRRFVSVRDNATPEQLARVEGDDLAGEVFSRYEGSGDELQLFDVRYPPHTGVSPHAHAEDEIIVVTEGELIFGKQSYGPGSSILIPRLTLYSFRAGPEGAAFLNFRPRRDTTVIRKQELREIQKASRSERDGGPDAGEAMRGSA